MGTERLGARIGAGREAEVYGWGEAVVKLYRPGFGGDAAEAAALSALDGRGIAPRLLRVVERDGRTGLVLERLAGPDMLTLLPRRPWLLSGLARKLAGAHLALHRVAAPAGLPDAREVLAARIRDAGLPPRLRDGAARLLDGLPGGDRLCHGDLHPGNVLVAADRVGVIDWPNATRGVPEGDHARTLLLLRWAAPLPGASRPARALMAAGRAAFARGYARHYRRGLPPRQPTAWLVVHAAARLSEGVDGERPALVALLERAAARGTMAA